MAQIWPNPGVAPPDNPLTNPITVSEVVEACRANALFDAHRDDPEFGHRLLAMKPVKRVRRWPCGAFGSRISMSKQDVSARSGPSPHGGEHGKSRIEREQRRYGIVLRATAEKRPRAPLLDHPRAAPHHDRHRDRTALQPASTTNPPGPSHRASSSRPS